jgi:hypothetical protein
MGFTTQKCREESRTSCPPVFRWQRVLTSGSDLVGLPGGENRQFGNSLDPDMPLQRWPCWASSLGPFCRGSHGWVLIGGKMSPEIRNVHRTTEVPSLRLRSLPY